MWDGNIKNVGEIGFENVCRLDSSGSGQSPIADFCRHDDGISDSIRAENSSPADRKHHVPRKWLITQLDDLQDKECMTLYFYNCFNTCLYKKLATDATTCAI
jgi:hypothetical protein